VNCLSQIIRGTAVAEGPRDSRRQLTILATTKWSFITGARGAALARYQRGADCLCLRVSVMGK